MFDVATLPMLMFEIGSMHTENMVCTNFMPRDKLQHLNSEVSKIVTEYKLFCSSKIIFEKHTADA